MADIIQNIPEAYRLKQEVVFDPSNIVKNYPFGTPCKTTLHGVGVLGRFVGVSNDSSVSPDDEALYSIVLIATPEGTIIKTGRCYVKFGLSRAEMESLTFYEGVAKAAGRWYHESNNPYEMSQLGEFMTERV